MTGDDLGDHGDHGDLGALGDLAELKQFVLLHARALGLEPETAAQVRDRIEHDDGRAGSGSWVGEWSAEAERRISAGDLPGAISRYLLASFPYPRDAARQGARKSALSVFDAWRQAVPAVERLTVETPDGVFHAWARGLDRDRPKPVLVVTGGIVSVKEQWAPFLDLAAALGAAAVITEMPGVGENTLTYTRDSHRMYGAVLDAVADRADSTHAVLVALSFSGHLALRQAAVDERIRGVVTVGAPVARFFDDASWRPVVPEVTVGAVTHHAGLGGVDRAGLFATLADWGLTPQELEALRIPVAYVRSLRDEVIPNEEAELLRQHVAGLRLADFDDVHGSPGHIDEVREWMAAAVADMLGTVARSGLTLGTLQEVNR
ncbi:alpha/beta hydrolase [Streptacidiphilus sp. MAP12-33]|uniref:alpha/beta hydrolase n=1 Tax=Streptacidiphilus sp. MAP12-33 TaxID=3156266 RepID=UPI0035153BBE